MREDITVQLREGSVKVNAKITPHGSATMERVHSSILTQSEGLSATVLQKLSAIGDLPTTGGAITVSKLAVAVVVATKMPTPMPSSAPTPTPTVPRATEASAKDASSAPISEPMPDPTVLAPRTSSTSLGIRSLALLLVLAISSCGLGVVVALCRRHQKIAQPVASQDVESGIVSKRKIAWADAQKSDVEKVLPPSAIMIRSCFGTPLEIVIADAQGPTDGSARSTHLWSYLC